MKKPGGVTASAILSVIFFLVLFYVPFLNKAVHIDDGTLLEMSKAFDFSLSVKPGYVAYWMGNKTLNYYPFNATHPPLIPYYLKMAGLLTGEREEYLLHACFLIFPALLLLATYLLADELRIPPLPALLAVCANAAILPIGHTFMADVPMLSLWMIGAYLLVSGMKRTSPGRTALSFAVMSVAGLISYQTFLLLPAFFLFVALRKKTGLSMLPVFLLPLLAIGLFLVYASSRYSSPFSGTLGEISGGLRPDRLFNKGMSIPLYLGLAMLFILPLRYREIASSKKKTFAAAAAVLLAVPPVLSLAYPFWSSLWLMLLVSVGLFSIVYAAHIALVEFDDRPLGFFLIAWTLIVIAYNLFVLPFGSVRYIMPAVPPMVFLFMNKTSGKRALMVSGVLTALLGLAVAYGDYLYASSYRDFSAQVRNAVGPEKGRVWYIGEWGMHYYMQKEGFRYLTADSNEPGLGDLIMIADIPKLWSPSPLLYRRIELIDVVEMNSGYPLRLMGLGIKAGYYSSLWGYKPFTVSRLPVERFGVFRVYRNP